VLPPVLWLLVGFFRATLETRGHWFEMVARELFGRTVAVGALAMLLAAAIGIPYGWAAARFDLPGRKVWLAGSLLALLIPPYASALAWALVFTREGTLNRLLEGTPWPGPLAPHGSIGLAAFVIASVYWPLFAWFTALAARAVPADLEDAARLHLPAHRAALFAARPHLLRAWPAACLLVLLLALGEFGTSSYLGVITYPVALVSRFQHERDAALILRGALPLVALLLPLLMLHLQVLHRLPVAPAGSAPRPVRLTVGGRALAAAACGAALLLTAGLPLGILAANSLPLDTYVAVWRESSDHFLNTLLTVAPAVAVAVLFGVACAWGLRRRPPFLLDLLLVLPYALPASLIGIALIEILNRPGPLGDIYTSQWALVWLYAALFFPFALKTIQPAVGQVDPALLDDALLLGAPPWVRFRVVAWPVLRPFAVIAAVVVGVLAAREIDATALLRVPGGDTIGFRIHDYLHFGPTPKVAALCILVVAATAALVLLASRMASERHSDS
jgi:iron(III) transport system permease protein